MKIQIPTKQLVSALATIKSIAKPSTTHVILGNVCITADNHGITLLGADLEKQLSIRIACTVKEPGQTTVPCGKLHDSLAKARGADCIIESNPAHEMTIRVGSAITKIRGLDPSELPASIGSSSGIAVSIPAGVFNGALATALVHSSSDKSRAMYCTVAAISKAGKLLFEATDTRRAAMVDTGIPFAAEDQFIIPKESVPMLSSIATEGNIEVVFSEGALSAKTDNCEFATKLIEGKLPDFNRAFPPDRPLRITFNRAEMISVLEYVETQTTIDAKRVLLECDGNKITATGAGMPEKANDAFMDMNQDTMPVEKGGSSISMTINPQFFRDSLKCFSGDQVTLEMADAMQAIIIQEDPIVCMIAPMGDAK